MYPYMDLLYISLGSMYYICNRSSTQYMSVCHVYVYDDDDDLLYTNIIASAILECVLSSMYNVHCI